MDNNLNISPKMSYGVSECDIVVTELHAYDFVIKDFVIKGGIIFVTPCIWVLFSYPLSYPMSLVGALNLLHLKQLLIGMELLPFYYL